MTEEQKVLLAWTSTIITEALNYLQFEDVDRTIDYLIQKDTEIKDKLYIERKKEDVSSGNEASS